MPVPLILGFICGISVIMALKLHAEQPVTAHAFTWVAGFNFGLFLHSIGV